MVKIGLPFLWLVMFLPCLAQPLVRLTISPMDFDGEHEDRFPNVVDQLFSIGELIYVRGDSAAFLTVIDRQGHILENLGRRGRGPGEFASGIAAAGVQGHHLFAMAFTKPDRLLHFHAGEYQRYFPLDVNPLSLRSASTNAFAVSEDRVVLPAHPKSGYLAFAYDFEGGKKGVGSLLFTPAHAELRENPFLNDTLWCYGPPFWYALLRYDPVILKFDADLNMVGSVQLDHPRILQLQEVALNYNRANFKIPPSVNFDFKFHHGFLFFMMRQTLVQVEPKTGKIAAMYTFHGEGESFAKVSNPTREVNFKTFALLPDGQIVVGPGFVFDHDLWTAKLPDLSPNHEGPAHP